MINKRFLQIILFLLGLVVLAWIFSNIFSYFVISLILSAILSPLTNYINGLHFYGYHMPRFVAVLMSFAVIIVVISLFVILFIPLIDDQVQIITNIDYEALYYRASAPLQQLEDFLYENRVIAEEAILVENLRQSLLSIVGSINFGEFFNQVLSLTGSVLVGLLAVVFTTFILLYEKGIVRRQVIKLIPNQYFEVFIAAIYKIETLLSNYLIGLLFQIFSIFCIASLGLSLLGVNYALTIAIFAALANLIPYAGPLLGSLFGIAVGLSASITAGNTNDMIIIAIKIISVFAVVQITDNILLQPLIFSKSVKAHPLEIFVVIFAGATLAGVLGMIAAIPVYTILKVVYLELYTGYNQYHIFKSK